MMICLVLWTMGIMQARGVPEKYRKRLDCTGLKRMESSVVSTGSTSAALAMWILRVLLCAHAFRRHP